MRKVVGSGMGSKHPQVSAIGRPLKGCWLQEPIALEPVLVWRLFKADNCHGTGVRDMEGTMRAVRLYAPADLRCVEIPIPQPGADEVLIKVKAVGICGSDPARVMEKGTYSFPTTIGHEFAGEISDVGADVQNWNVGDRVTIVPLVPCYECEYCQIGEYTLCDDYSYYGSREDGALADYIKVKQDNLLRLPENVSFDEGACTEPCSVALHACSEIKPGHTAVGLDVVPSGTSLLNGQRFAGLLKSLL